VTSAEQIARPRSGPRLGEPGEPEAARRHPPRLDWAWLPTPVGPVSAGCGPAGLAQVRFGLPPASAADGAPDSGAPGSGGTGSGRTDPGGATGTTDLARAARRQLAEFFCGRRREFDLPLDWSGFAPAQRHVLGLLHEEVGYGQTITYGRLAERAGLPAAADIIPARAVGQIMGSNPIPIVVPCHRVVASDGLGGYSGGAGPEVKRWLLIMEGAFPPTLDWIPADPPD
jgi:methylated-DNA-[protein]-cysteine S-methyltransferase